MNKLKMESVDITEQNIDRIAELFPQVVTEVADPSGAKNDDGTPRLRKAIDFDKLKLVLSAGTGDYVVADDDRERYEFTWVGKRQSMIDAATPIRKTLRPCPADSKDWATTENLYIEGDNLEVLKLLQESYLGKVKMIYIDPPYNTGKDFIYKDNFTQSREEYEEELDMFDEEGNRLFQNTETNGRFHSDWCSMIYPRLQLARNLLTDDGVIFISIDDNEVRNLKNICDEVFGEGNFVGNICRATGTTTGQDANKIGSSLDYCFVYSKADSFQLKGIAMDEKDIKRFNGSDEKGQYSTLQLRKTGNSDTKEDRPNMFYPIISPDNSDVYPFGPTGYLSRWRVAKETYEQLVENNMIIWKKSETKELVEKDGFVKSIWIPYVKYYLEGRTKQVSNLFQDIEGNKKGSLIVKELFGNKGIFDNPKPVEFLNILLQISTNTDSVILDFFSGSATTAHAVMQLNAEDGGNRKFIMVQLPEVCDPNSEAAKAGYSTICEIGKERIRRAGEKINKERIDRIQKEAEKEGVVADIASLDTGFRVFKLDSTNMKDVYYAAGQLSQKELWDTVSNIKDDRSDIDLLYGCLLDWGVQLTMPHTTEQIESFTVHTVDSPLTDEIDLIACFDSNVSETVVRTIAKRKPTRALFRDASFADSANKINVFEIFKSISPDTTVKVI